MKGFYTLLFILLFTTSQAVSDGRIIDYGKIRTSGMEGTEFLIAFPQNEIDRQDKVNSLTLVYTITSLYEDNEVTIRNNYTREVQKVTFLRNETGVFEADLNLEVDEPSKGLLKSLRIKSKHPVLVYVYSHYTHSMDSYAALPIDQWGTEYTAVSMPIDNYDYQGNTLDYTTPRKGQVVFIANEDNTNVTFNPSDDLDSNFEKDKNWTITLRANQVFSIEPSSAQVLSGDITGTTITSDKPIGVLSGHNRSGTEYSQVRGARSKDHLVEMLIPKTRWKNEYITIPFYSDSISRRVAKTFYKITVEDSVDVYAEHNGSDYKFEFDSDKDFRMIEIFREPVKWYSDKKFQITQIMGRDQQNYTNSDHDPAFLNANLSRPTDNYLYFYSPVFVIGGNPLIENKIALVIETSALPFLKHNGVLVWNEGYGYERIDNNLSLVRLNAKSGINIVTCENGFFSANTYGVGELVSYAHNLTSGIISEPGRETQIVFEPVISCDSFEIDIKSLIDLNEIGIKWIDIYADLSSNVDYQVDYQPFEKGAIIRGNLIDKTRDGKITIEVVDEEQTKAVYELEIKGNNIWTTQIPSFGDVPIGDEICIGDAITNRNNYAVVIDSILFPVDDRLVVFPDSLIGKIIPPGETLLISYCFTAKDSVYEGLNDSITYITECGTYTKYFKANLLAPALDISGHDFGSIRSTDNKCAQISISNTGNIKNVIYGLEFDDSFGFTIDTVGFFPMVLDVDESIDNIPICFSRLELGEVEISILCNDSLNLQPNTSARANVLEPEFEGITINFGKVRTGIVVDTTIRIENIGDYKGSLTYIGAPIGDDEINSDLDNEYKDIEANDYIEISISYSPQLGFIGLHSKEYEIEVDKVYWSDWGERKIYISVEAEAIEPSIEAKDYYLGEFLTGESFSSDLLDLFEFGGNDSINILEVNFISDGFLLEKDRLFPQEKRWNGDYYQKEFTLLADESQDEYEILVELVTDAGLAYSEKRDTAQVTANSLSIPFQSPKMRIEQEDLISCVEGEYLIYIEDLHIDENVLDLKIEDGCFDNLSFPDISKLESYRTDGGYQIPISVISRNDTDCSGNIMARTSYDTTLVLERLDGNVTIDTTFKSSIEIEFDIKPTIPSISWPEPNVELKVVHNDSYSSGPNVGDIITIFYELEFTHTKEILYPQEISLEALFDITLLHTLKESGKLNYNEQEYELSIEETALGHRINLPEDLKIEEGVTEFTFSIDYLVLINGKTGTDLELVFDINDCFEPQFSTYPINIEKVCDFHLRNVTNFSKLQDVEVLYDAVNSSIDIEIELGSPSLIGFEIYTSDGRLVHNDKKFLESGTNSTSIDATNLSSGSYFVRVTQIQKQYNQRISINK
ncbi:MAG: hypothetical protein Kapaf2KO_06090 [Candidatus Kapaibacteriales bacterium]